MSKVLQVQLPGVLAQVDGVNVLSQGSHRKNSEYRCTQRWSRRGVEGTDPLDLLSARKPQEITHTPVLVREATCEEAAPPSEPRQVENRSQASTHHTGPDQPGPAGPTQPAAPPSCQEASGSPSSSASCLRETQPPEGLHGNARNDPNISRPAGEAGVLSDSALLLVPTQVIRAGRSSADSCPCERSPHPPPPWSPGGGSRRHGHTPAPAAGGDRER